MRVKWYRSRLSNGRVLGSSVKERPVVYHSFLARSPGDIPVQMIEHIHQHECEPSDQAGAATGEHKRLAIPRVESALGGARKSSTR